MRADCVVIGAGPGGLTAAVYLARYLRDIVVLDDGRSRALWIQAHSITDLAEQKGVTVAYVCRLLPLTCLAPDVVEAILDGRQPKGLRLAVMLGNKPLEWEQQRGAWGLPSELWTSRGSLAPHARVVAR